MRERGQALIVAILALLVLTLLGLALTSMSMLSMTVSTNDREANEALYAADSGIAHAVAVLAWQQWLSFDQVLQSGDGRACSGDELEAPPLSPPRLPASELIPAAGRAFPPVGSYRVSVCDDDSLERVLQPPALPDRDPSHDANERVLIRSTGAGSNGASATIEAILARVELPAVLVDGHLLIDGDLSVMGVAGSVHANGSLALSGSPCAQQSWSAAGSAFGAAARGGPGCLVSAADVRPLQDPIPVPAITPASLRARADYILGGDGLIRDRAGAVVTPAGWSWDSSSRRWWGGGNLTSGTYYVEGNVEISGDPGRGELGPSPLPLTLVAEGWVDITGNPNLVPAIAGTPAYSVVAGTDLRLAGSATTDYLGVFYAEDQIELSGEPRIHGQLIAKNNGDFGFPALRSNAAQNNLVQLRAGTMVLSGGAIVSYDGGGGLNSLTLVGWRECRGSDPDNPCGPP